MALDDPIAEAHRQWVLHGWAPAADGMAMVTSVVRVHQILMERIDTVLRPYALTFARFEILRVLDFSSQGALPMSKLGSLLQVHATSITSAVARLQEQGFVDRTASPRDGRVVLATITVSGRAIVDEVTEHLNSEVFEAPGLSRPDVDQLITLLSRHRAAAGDPAAERITTGEAQYG